MFFDTLWEDGNKECNFMVFAGAFVAVRAFRKKSHDHFMSFEGFESLTSSPFIPGRIN